MMFPIRKQYLIISVIMATAHMHTRVERLTKALNAGRCAAISYMQQPGQKTLR